MQNTIKAIKNEAGDWILEVLGIPFGGPFDGRDADGEFFSDKSELWLDKIGSRPVVHYHGRSADGKPDQIPEVIGQELGYEVKEDGVWFKVALDKAKETARQLWEAAQSGFVRASSGAINHLVRIGDSGHIDLWPVAELSLMNIDAGNYPANPYAVAVPHLRSLYKAAKLDLPDIVDTQPEEQGAESPPPVAQILSTTHNNNDKESKMTEPKDTKQAPEAKGLTAEDIERILDAREAEKAEKARIAKLEEQAKLVEQLQAKLAELEKQSEGRDQIKKLQNPADDAGDGGKGPDVQVFSRYDGFDVTQLGMAYDMLKAVGKTPSAELYRALHAKAQKLADSGDIYAKQIVRNDRGEILREFSPTVNAGLVKAIKSINPMQLQDVKATKADELMYSTQASYGDEWVPTLWSSELWDLVRNQARVMSRFRQVEVPGESLTIPTLAGKTTLYKIAQTNDQSELDLSAVTAQMTKASTSNVTLTPKKGMAWLSFTTELDEDSIIPMMPTLQATLVADIAEQMDEIIISGDTDTTTNNISDTGNGSIAATWRLLILNGLRDAAFAASNTSDRGALTAEDFTAVMALLGTNGALALDPERLFWVFDPGVYRKALLLGEVLTADKMGGIGTFQSGRLVRVFGSDVVVSDQYKLTDANGKIHNTAGNNTQGSFLLVRPDRFVLGFGRRITIETPARDLISIASDTRHLLASFRVDMAKHSTDDAAALGYNVTV